MFCYCLIDHLTKLFSWNVCCELELSIPRLFLTIVFVDEWVFWIDFCPLIRFISFARRDRSYKHKFANLVCMYDLTHVLGIWNSNTPSQSVIFVPQNFTSFAKKTKLSLACIANDIAVITIKQMLFAKRIKPVCIWRLWYAINSNVFYTVWGCIQRDGFSTSSLQNSY